MKVPYFFKSMQHDVAYVFYNKKKEEELKGGKKHEHDSREMKILYLYHKGIYIAEGDNIIASSFFGYSFLLLRLL